MTISKLNTDGVYEATFQCGQNAKQPLEYSETFEHERLIC